MKNQIQEYTTVLEDGNAEIIEKKSRFIAYVHSVETDEEAIAYLEEIRKKHWDARHNCYAYIIGRNSETVRCSDDGEPGGTAGRPILDTMLNANLTNAIIVVTRYFGGVLLGTGGLVRAYTQSAGEGIQNAVVGTMQLMSVLLIRMNYDQVGKIKNLLAREKVLLLEELYEADVLFKIAVVINKKEDFINDLIECTNARIDVEEKDICYKQKIN